MNIGTYGLGFCPLLSTLGRGGGGGAVCWVCTDDVVTGLLLFSTFNGGSGMEEFFFLQWSFCG